MSKIHIVDNKLFRITEKGIYEPVKMIDETKDVIVMNEGSDTSDFQVVRSSNEGSELSLEKTSKYVFDSKLKEPTFQHSIVPKFEKDSAHVKLTSKFLFEQEEEMFTLEDRSTDRHPSVGNIKIERTVENKFKHEKDVEDLEKSKFKFFKRDPWDNPDDDDSDRMFLGHKSFKIP